MLFRKGIMFRVDIVAKDISGEMSVLSGPELMSIFEGILKETAGVTDTIWNPFVFTTQNRALWSQVY